MRKSRKMNVTPRKSLDDFSNKEMQQLQTNSLLKIQKKIRDNNRVLKIIMISLWIIGILILVNTFLS